MTLVLFSKMVSIFIMLMVGVLCSKLSIVDGTTKDKMSKLSTQVVNPLLIFMSFQVDFDTRLLRNMGAAFVAAFVIHLLAVAASGIFVSKNGKYDHAVERAMLIYSNCGFMGIPLASAVFGNEGVMYATTFIAVFSIFIWTQGVGMFQDAGSLLMKKLINPALIAIILGLICFALQIRVPESIGFALNSVGDMNTPLAMIVAGAVIGELKLKEIFSGKRIYLIVALKLILFPVFFCLLLHFLPLDPVVRSVMGMQISCPSAATGIMFAILYEKDDHYAAEIFAMTTLLSIVTLPLCMHIL